MNKIPKNVQRAYAIASYIGASLKVYEVADPELHQLELQCKRAMRVYSAKAGKQQTLALADKLGDLWQELGGKYSHTIDENSVPALIEGISMIISPKDFKDFIGVSPYYKHRHQYYADYWKIMDSANSLNWKLNELLGTKSVVMQKPKVIKPKIKKERTKTKKLNKHEKQIIADREKNERITSFLRDRIKSARRNND